MVTPNLTTSLSNEHFMLMKPGIQVHPFSQSPNFMTYQYGDCQGFAHAKQIFTYPQILNAAPQQVVQYPYMS
jgi:hypothetical protein